MFRKLAGLLRRRTTIPVIQLSGAIGISTPMRTSLSLDKVAATLKAAFGYKSAPAVALLINSPGGAPVQAHMIHQRIRQLATEKEKTVIAFVEDVAASGGYMLACAGDEIIADPASIVGSIGVVSQGFGFVGLLERIGVERRLHTAGDRKAILDPFSPEVPEDVAHLETLQQEIHDHFIELVRARRGDRLADDPELFSGLFWTGKRAVAMGLVDRLGDARAVLRQRYGEEIRLRLLRPARPGLLRRLFGGGAMEIAAAVDERALWARYGL